MDNPSRDRELFGTLLATTPARVRSWNSLAIAIVLHAAFITLAIITFKPFSSEPGEEEAHPLSIIVVEEDAVQPLPNPFVRSVEPVAAAPLAPRKPEEDLIYRPGPLAPIVVEEGPPVAAPADEPKGVAGGRAGGAAGGSLSGRLMPSGADPRIVGSTPRAFPAPEKTGAEALRERLSNTLSAWNDSVAAEAEASRRSTDWTVRDKNGGRWGVAPDGIYLGKIKLPAVALAPPAGKRDEINARNRDFNEIEKQAYLEESRSSFKERVQAIRQRKERERAEKQRAKTEDKPITESR
jgi:hypothetical protein